MRTKLLKAVFLFSLSFNMYAQSLAWAKQLGGTSPEQGLSITVDGSGNVYSTGSFSGTADFDPGAGSFTMSAFGGTDIFVSKLDPLGNFLWAKQMGSTSADVGRAIAVDASGNVYTAGVFLGTGDFDPGIGTFTLSTGGGTDVFISKLDANGNFIWAKSFKGPNVEQCYSLKLDISGNVYTTGFFDNSTDFDPGAGFFYLTPVGGNDVYVTKLSSAGNFVWAKQIGDFYNDEGKSLAIDPFGNVVITGSFRGLNVDFDPGAGISNLSSSGLYDAFITKLDANGNFIWAKVSAAGTGTASSNPVSITTDPSGNVYSTGTFEMTTDFDPSPGNFTITSLGYKDIYISKIDANGNFVWTKGLGASLSDDTPYSLATDASGSVFTIGNFGGTIDFDSGPGTFSLSASATDIFILKLVPGGNFAWVKQIGGAAFDYGTSIALDAAGSVYTTGYFALTIDFDPDAGVYNLTSSGSTDAFVLKLQLGALEINPSFDDLPSIKISPNPNNGLFWVENDVEKADIVITNSLGEIVFKDELSLGRTDIQLESIPKGIYFVELQSAKNLKKFKIIIN